MPAEPPPKAKTRARTGCLTCRKRRRKCDERKPRCDNCKSKSLHCQYGVRVAFLSTNAISLSQSDLEALQEAPQSSYQDISFVHQTKDEIYRAADSTDEDTHGPSMPLDPDTNPPDAARTRVLSQYQAQTPVSEPPLRETISSPNPPFPPTPAMNSHSTPTPGFVGFEDNMILHNMATPIMSPLTPPHVGNRINREYSLGGVQSLLGWTPTENSLGSTTSIMNSSEQEQCCARLAPILHVDMAQAGGNMDVDHDIADSERVTLIKFFIDRVSTWLDVCIPGAAFGVDYPILAKSHPVLMYAVLALASQAREIQGPGERRAGGSTALFNRAVGLLRNSETIPTNTFLQVSSFLCLYRLIGSEPRVWDTFLQPLQDLCQLCDEDELTKVVLAAMNRYTMGFTTLRNQALQSQFNLWLPTDVPMDDARFTFQRPPILTNWAKYSMYLCSKVMLLKSRHEGSTTGRSSSNESDQKYSLEWESLWKQVNSWQQELPLELRPILNIPAGKISDAETQTFPTVMYTTGTAMVASLLHHFSAMVMLQIKPRVLKLSRHNRQSAAWYAVQVCGISISNESPGAWDVAVVAAVLNAGRLLSFEGQQRELLAHVSRIQKATGWKIAGEVVELEAWWGFSNEI